jgi:hypothetical protein
LRKELKHWAAGDGSFRNPRPSYAVLAQPRPLGNDASVNTRVKIHQYRLSGHFWDQLELPFQARDGLLFSPGNVHPLLSPFLGPAVVTVHDLAYRPNPKAYTAAFRLTYGVLVPAALRKADAIITVSESEKHNIVARSQPSRIVSTRSIMALPAPS